MRFAKIEEGRCSYLCVDCTNAPTKPDRVAQQMHGHSLLAGCACLLLAYTSDRADVRLHSFNGDGKETDSVDGICGFAAFVYTHGLVRSTHLTVEVGRLILSTDLQLSANRVGKVNVSLGCPVLHPPVGMPMTFPDTVFDVTRLSVVGEPHSVTFVHELTDNLLQEIGPQIRSRLSFPTPTNVEFAKLNRRDDVTVRMLKNDAGEAIYSYAGACAVAVAGCLTGRTQRKLAVHMSGCTVEVSYPEKGDGYTSFVGSAMETMTGELEDTGAKFLS